MCIVYSVTFSDSVTVIAVIQAYCCAIIVQCTQALVAVRVLTLSEGLFFCLPLDVYWLFTLVACVFDLVCVRAHERVASKADASMPMLRL